MAEDRGICIIPVKARVDSKRVPGKNFAPVGNQTMLDWTLDRLSDVFPLVDIVVSTDSIYKLLDKSPFLFRNLSSVRVIERGIAAMDPNAPTLTVVLDALARVGVGGENRRVSVAQATMPLVRFEDYIGAMQFSSAENAPVVMVARAGGDVMLLGDGKRLTVLPPSSTWLNADRYYYVDVGGFYTYPASTLSTLSSMYQGALGYVVPRWVGVDVDEEEDLRLVRLLYKAINPPVLTL
jgi:CMP-N-acetylneuraminic acid synthetase